MYTQPVGAGPALLVMIGVTAAAAWLHYSDPVLARTIVQSRSMVDWAAFAGLLLAVVVGVGMVINAIRTVGQVFRGLGGLAALVAVVAVIVLCTGGPRQSRSPNAATLTGSVPHVSHDEFDFESWDNATIATEQAFEAETEADLSDDFSIFGNEAIAAEDWWQN